MARFEITLPGGESYEIDGVESQEQAWQMLQGQQRQTLIDQGVERNQVLEGQTQEMQRQRVPTAFGAPTSVRAAVGASPSAQGRLAALKAYYPDARPYGDDNFVYTDETGQTRMFNEEGWIPDLGDIAEAGPDISEMLGGTFGAIAGGLAGAPAGGAGAVPGAMLGAGAGSLAGRRLYNAGMQLFTPARETRGLGAQALGDVQTAALGAAGEGVGRALGEVGSMALRKIFTTPGATERAAQFAAAGVDPSGAGAEIAGSKPAALLTKTTEMAPGSYPLARARGRTLESMQQRVGEVAQEMAGGPVPTRGTAGATLQEGARAAGGRFAATQRGLRQNMLDLTQNVSVGADELGGIRTLRDQFNDQIGRSPGTSGHLVAARDEMDRLLGDVAEGQAIPYAQLRQYQTDLQQRLTDPSMATGYVGKARQGLDRVLRTLKGDLGTAVQSQAPDAMPAVREHDAFVVDFLETQRSGLSSEKMLEKMAKMESDKLVDFAMRGAKKGGERLYQIRSLMDDADWNQFRAAIVDDMGRAASDDTFTATQFRGAYNRMTPEAREALFGRQGRQLENLNEVGKLIADVEKAENYSRTAPTAEILGALGAGGFLIDPGAALTVASAVPTAFGVSKALTSPRFARWAGGGQFGGPASEALMGAVGREALPPLMDVRGLDQFER